MSAGPVCCEYHEIGRRSRPCTWLIWFNWSIYWLLKSSDWPSTFECRNPGPPSKCDNTCSSVASRCRYSIESIILVPNLVKPRQWKWYWIRRTSVGTPLVDGSITFFTAFNVWYWVESTFNIVRVKPFNFFASFSLSGTYAVGLTSGSHTGRGDVCSTGYTGIKLSGGLYRFPSPTNSLRGECMPMI